MKRRRIYLQRSLLAFAISALLLGTVFVFVPHNNAIPKNARDLKMSDTKELLPIGHQLLHNSLGNETSLLTGSFPSESQGFAIAVGTRDHRERLVSTVNAGRSWSERGLIPSSVMSDSSPQPTTYFVDARVGYVQPDIGSSIYMTKDSGRSWSRLPVAGKWLAMEVSRQRIWVVSSHCSVSESSPSSSCPATLTSLAIGSAHLDKEMVLPRGVWAAVQNGDFELSNPSPGVLGVSISGVSEFGGSLIFTRDEGASWHVATWPCRNLGFVSLVGTKGGSWVLSCFLGGGMTQGTSEIWRSSNDGATWHELGSANEEQSNQVGSIRDLGYSLVGNSANSAMYAELSGAGSNFAASFDGGLTWKDSTLHFEIPSVSLALDGNDGVVIFAGEKTYWSSNGQSWVQRLLPRNSKDF